MVQNICVRREEEKLGLEKDVRLKLLFSISLLGILLIVSTPAMSAFVGLLSPAETSSTTTVFVDPESFVRDYDELPVGSTFTVHVNVSDVTDLYTWQINMSWDTSLLNVSSSTGGEFLMRTVSPNKTSSYQLGFMINITDNVEGYSCMAESVLGDFSGVSDSGRLVSIEFLVLGYGSCNLTINVEETLGTTLFNSTGDSIGFTKIDGYFSNRFLSDIRGPEDPPGGGQYPPDASVDMWDFGFIGLAYGKTSASPDWEDYKIADIRGPEDPPGSGLYPPDGQVDMWDFGYCGLQYGKTYP